MKYLFTDQNFHISKLPLFHEFNFLRKDIYVNKRKHYKCLIFFIVKFNYFTGPYNQYFIFITYPIVASLCSSVFPETSLTTDPDVSATNLQT